jgi:Fe-S cluster biogenesis protein NfuA
LTDAKAIAAQVHNPLKIKTMQIFTEITPNPQALKFVTDRTLLAQGVADFATVEEAESGSQLASKLFKYPFVKGVFIGSHFVTVTKSEEGRWENIIPVMKDEIQRFVQSGTPIVERAEQVANTEDDSEVVQKIRQLIDDQVRPAVAMDGGDIIYEGFEDGVVKLKLRGSCSGCPSSTLTLKSGIQNLLTRLVPEVKSVEAING